MGIIAGISAAAATASLASSASGLFSGGGGSGGGSGAGGYSGGSSPPPAYIPQQQPGADQSYYQLAQALSQGGSNLVGQAGNSLYNAVGAIQNNPYAAQSQIGANNAYNYGVFNLSPQQQGAASSLFGAGNSVLNTAFDPQTSLYNQLFQQTNDQSNAVNAMNGVAGTPYGAGLMNQADTNFNINWQNAQLQRQQQGIQSAGQAYAGGSDLGGTGLATLATSAGLPYSTFGGQQNDIVNSVNSLTSGTNGIYGLDQNSLNALAAYLKLGQSATSVGQAGAAQNFSNNQALGSGIGSSLSQLANNPGLAQLFGGGSSGIGNYGYTSQPSYYDPSYFDSSANTNYGNAGY